MSNVLIIRGFLCKRTSKFDEIIPILYEFTFSVSYDRFSIVVTSNTYFT